MYQILVACHCKTPIPKVTPSKISYTSSPRLTINLQSDKIKLSTTNISYIDTDTSYCPRDEGQYHIWEDIPSKSFDSIWFQYCPLWTGTESSIIVRNALRVLKDNGQIIVLGYNLDEGDTHDDIESDAIFMNRTILGEKLNIKNVKLSIVSQKDLPFVMTSPKDTYPSNSHYMILTKLSISGGRKRKRTIKRSRNNRKKIL